MSTRIWRYKTTPKRSYGPVLRSFLRPVMLLAAGGKVSHWFDWYNTRIPLQAGLEIPSSAHAFTKRRPWDEVRMSLGGWQEGAVLSPEPDVPWQIAYRLNRVNDEIIVRRCALILQGPARVLRGPGTATYYAFEAGTETPIGLRVIGRFRRRRVGPWQHLPLV